MMLERRRYQRVPVASEAGVFAPGILERRRCVRVRFNTEKFPGMPSLEEDKSWAPFVQAAKRCAALRGTGGPSVSDWRHLVANMDASIRNHAYQVARMTVLIARAMEMSAAEIDRLRLAALLHDVGKQAIPRAILAKPGPLTAQERQIVRRHPSYAKDLLTDVGAEPEVVDAAYAHHERWDGNGYPLGLHATDIPLVGRIVAVADVVDALSSKRSYQEAWPPSTVRSYIATCAGTQLDPLVVDTYLNLPTA
jgi:putative nucleotidyltransferase with HDIG domain